MDLIAGGRVPNQRSRVVHVVHHTRYDYQCAVAQSWQLAHLTPRSHDRQTVLRHALTVLPAEGAAQAVHQDYFGNPTVVMTLHRVHASLDVVAESEVLVHPERPDTAACQIPWDCNETASLDGALAVALAQYRAPSPRAPVWAAATRYARRSFRPGRPFAAALDDLNARIHADWVFDPEASSVMTPVERAFERRRGVCQDFAHVMVSCLRGLGIPARYVSGYIVTQPPPGAERLVGADASHAWVSAWCPGHGWIDIDPTNCRRLDQDFVTLGWGRDFSDVTPLRGVVLGGGAQQLSVRVTVTPDP